MVEMYYEGWFWLPCLVTIAVILLSLPVFSKLLKKRGIQSATAVTARNTSSASPSASEYEVFLSFRGNDTRKGFTDFLYTYLVDVGIRTFRDNNELRVGEEIGPELLKAIRESKISIPIFSRDYASSKWCLLELVQMVECRKTLGQKILPIFYDVEPSDVQHQTGSYEKAFRQHKKRFNEKTVQGWKEALREVGELKGWELNKETDGHQGELAKMVVEKSLLELKKNYTVVTENLVGIDHHVEKMTEFLNVDSDDVRIVGIHGMGGIGKTTIAKVIYNQLFEHFECCCFLADVREMSQTKGLVYLQIQLISKILKGKCPNIVDVGEGINTIKDTVCRKKVLIVLDDVDEKSQFDKLAGKCDWYGSRSRIIVTTRNKEVLNGLKVDKMYEPPLMEPDHSLQLFSKHAFKRDSPLEDYDTLSREVVSTTAGLPLALEIIGSSLFLEGKEVWNDTLMKLKEIPDEKVQEQLRISYEALHYQQKQIFLDIACLFIGEDERNPFYMWTDCKFFPTMGINVLVHKSLVKIGDDNKLRMHDLLRDLGREIVRKENFQVPGNRSRLWLHEEALDILKRRMGTEKVEALCLKPSGFSKESCYKCFTNNEFTKLPNLRFLRVDDADLAGDFEHLLSNLRWLQWCGYPGNYTPTNFYLKNLVILDLSWSKITNDWEGWIQIKMATKLKVLNLSACNRLRRTPDLSTFATLERLILSGCASLDQIDPSIGNLINLRVLDIERTAITELPDAIGNLEKLEEINASHCDKLQGEIPSNIGRLSSLRILRLDSTKICSLPTSICGLSCLQILNLFDCKKLQSVPELPPSLTSLCVTFCVMETFPSLSHLMNLKELIFFECLSLVEIARDFGTLSKLETLSLYATGIESLPVEIGALSRLKQLEVEDCHNLQCILGLPSSLSTLCLKGCESVERLPDLSNLKNLSKLILVGCSELMEIQGLGKLELLTSLNVSWCGKLPELDGLPSSLFKLCLTDCESVERLPDLSNLKNLSELMLVGCSELMEIQGLGKLELLTSLYVSSCGKLHKLDGLPSSLFRLCLAGCESVERLPNLSNLKNLSELRLDGCYELMEIQGLGKLELLTSLDLSSCGKLHKLDGLPSSLFGLCLPGCESVERLPDLSNLKNLLELRLDGCYELREIQGLGKLELLTSLNVSSCGKLHKLDGLASSSLFRLSLACCESVERLLDLSNLKILLELRLDGCCELMEIQGLGKLELLTSLDVSSCGKLHKLDGLPSSLFRLRLACCESVERLPDLSNLKILSELRLDGCYELMEIQGLGKLEFLTILDVSWCGKLPKLVGLEQLESLRYLNTSNCESLERLPDLSKLKKLKKLISRFCKNLIEIQGLDRLESLEHLDMGQCMSIERLPDLSNLGMLKQLKLWGCQKLAEVEGLWVLESLERLDVSWCISLERLLDLSKLKNLKELKIRGWKNLTEIRGLEELESLELLDIAGCKLIEKLPDLSNLKNLKELNVFRCEKLTEIRGLKELESLTLLDIFGCKSIENLPHLPNTNILTDS